MRMDRGRLLWCSAFLVLCLFPQLAAAPPITGTLRTIAEGLTSPRAVAVDAQGNVFIAESTGDVIRMISAATSIISTYAEVDQPVDIAIDPEGNLYVATGSLGRVWKIDTAHNVTAFAGSGDAASPLGDNGPALNARLKSAAAVALGSGGILYIADATDHRVRKVDASGIITTIAGTGTAGFGGEDGPAVTALLRSPSGLAVTPDGAVYIADRLNSRIRRIDPGTGIIDTVAGRGEWGTGGLGDGGPAVSAWIYDPYGITIDSTGVLYISDAAGSRVWKVDAAGQIATVIGTNVAGFNGDEGELNTRQVNWPKDVSLDVEGRLYVADIYNYRVRRVTFGSSGYSVRWVRQRATAWRAAAPDDGDSDRADDPVEDDPGEVDVVEDDDADSADDVVAGVGVDTLPGAGAVTAPPPETVTAAPVRIVRELTLDEVGPAAALPDDSDAGGSGDGEGGGDGEEAGGDTPAEAASGCSLILT